MNEREFNTEEIPMIEWGTNDTQPLTLAELAGAAAIRKPISSQAYLGREHDAIDDQSAVDRQSEEAPAPLFDQRALQDFRSRWGAIQTGFVDDPGGAVKQADELVAAVMERLAEVFADERAKLEEELARRDDVSTEDLRVAIRRYRSFFDRLLSVSM